MSTNYEYFCGANIAIKMGDAVVGELAGISYNVLDSKTPIYGYSSRLFDAVAPGQKLVQGSFVANAVEANYIFHKGREGSRDLSDLQKDVTNLGPFNISIHMGGDEGAYEIFIASAFIIGQASTIQIDEQVILQEYNFIARDLKEIKNS